MRRSDIFYTTVTPAWFTWLGWVALLSALKFVAESAPGNRWARLLWGLSSFLVFMYFNALFTRLRVVGVPKLSARALRLISLVLGGGAAIAASLMSLRVAELLMAASR